MVGGEINGLILSGPFYWEEMGVEIGVGGDSRVICCKEFANFGRGLEQLILV